ncbi:unnamed protein product [Enterobius vermicularis]|uniref:CLN6 transmembrane ER protein n=1 Tax=Enterobius vermicularis TaxID=51028 RepID=A0A0N4VMK0_ENTVE|nr:unnamed protein product [Enterobius vermicularis]
MASVSAAKKQKEEEETKKERGENLEEKAPPPGRPGFSADMYNSYLRMFYCVFLSSFAAISFEQSQG